MIEKLTSFRMGDVRGTYPNEYGGEQTPNHYFCDFLAATLTCLPG
mgnify:CR=1